VHVLVPVLGACTCLHACTGVLRLLEQERGGAAHQLPDHGARLREGAAAGGAAAGRGGRVPGAHAVQPHLPGEPGNGRTLKYKDFLLYIYIYILSYLTEYLLLFYF